MKTNTKKLNQQHTKSNIENNNHYAPRLSSCSPSHFFLSSSEYTVAWDDTWANLKIPNVMEKKKKIPIDGVNMGVRISLST